MASKKRKLTLRKKVELVDTFDAEKLSVRDLAKRFKVETSQAAGIVSLKDKIRVKWQSEINQNQEQSLLECDSNAIDSMCYAWFLEARSQNIPITGQLVKAKANQLAQQFGNSGFSASDKWLKKWCLGHNIFSVGTPAAAATMVYHTSVNKFRQKLPSLLSGYRREDILNVDESKLFFRALTNRRLFNGSNKSPDWQVSKELLTILFCVNMAGKKEDLFIVGSFEDHDIKDSPRIWRSNEFACLTDDVMIEWLRRFDRKIGRRNRKILMFLNSTRSHCGALELENIKLEILEPDTTSVCQPLDRGIIYAFKCLYKDQILRYVLSKITRVKSLTEISRTLDVVEAIHFIRSSWKEVGLKIIRKSFRKAGFRKIQPQKYLEEGVIDIGDKIETEGKRNADSESESESDMDSDTSGCYHGGLERLDTLKEFAGNDLKTCEIIRQLEKNFENHLVQQKWTA